MSLGLEPRCILSESDAFHVPGRYWLAKLGKHWQSLVDYLDMIDILSVCNRVRY